MLKILVTFIFVFGFEIPFAYAKNCGGTIQTFWNLNRAKDELRLKSIFRHPGSSYCEKSLGNSANVTIEILNGKKEKIRGFETYIRTLESMESGNENEMHAIVSEPEEQNLQLKFADDAEFKKAKFLKITFQNGKSYGPSSF